MTLMDTTAETTVGNDAYTAPRIELAVFPRTLDTFDGFLVAGRASGSDVEGAQVQVCVAGVVRTGTVRDGAWTVRFEDRALWGQHAGVRPVTGRVTDSRFNGAEATEWVTVVEFVDGHVHVDGRHDVEGDLDGGVLHASGELGLGTHDLGRELVVLLVRDDEEGAVASVGVVEPGWESGEWRARLPMRGLTPGSYRVRALLTDKACAGLTRLAVGLPFRLP
jgi:hypothetical protein